MEHGVKKRQRETNVIKFKISVLKMEAAGDLSSLHASWRQKEHITSNYFHSEDRSSRWLKKGHFVHPENGGSTWLKSISSTLKKDTASSSVNTGTYIQHHTASQPRWPVLIPKIATRDAYGSETQLKNIQTKI